MNLSFAPVGLEDPIDELDRRSNFPPRTLRHLSRCRQRAVNRLANNLTLGLLRWRMSASYALRSKVSPLALDRQRN